MSSLFRQTPWLPKHSPGEEDEDLRTSPSPQPDEDSADEYLPGDDSMSSQDDCSTASEQEAADPVTDGKFIVWGSQLDQLFSHCRKCQLPVTSVTKTERASSLTVTRTVCEGGHRL